MFEVVKVVCTVYMSGFKCLYKHGTFSFEEGRGRERELSGADAVRPFSDIFVYLLL